MTDKLISDEEFDDDKDDEYFDAIDDLLYLAYLDPAGPDSGFLKVALTIHERVRSCVIFFASSPMFNLQQSHSIQQVELGSSDEAEDPDVKTPEDSHMYKTASNFLQGQHWLVMVLYQLSVPHIPLVLNPLFSFCFHAWSSHVLPFWAFGRQCDVCV
jgi:hypothetical protein